MVQQVDVDGEIHEFPDDATPDMMKAALRKYAARKEFMNYTQKNTFERPIEKIGGSLSDTVKNIGSTVAKGVPSLLAQGFSEPRQAGKNIAAGLSSIPFNMMSAILNAPQYVAGLESDRASNFLKKYTPEIPVERIVNASFGEPSQSDTNVRNLSALTPILVPGAKFGARGISGGAKKVIGTTDRALEANEALLGNNIDNKRIELDQKTAAVQAADEANREVISQSKQALGKSDADLMQYNVAKRQQDISNMTDEATKLQNQLFETKPDETDLSTAQENLTRSQNQLQNVGKMKSDIDTNIGQHLNMGAQHDVRFSQGLTHRIDAIENYANDTYKNLMRNISDAQFQMPKAAMEKLDYDKMSPTQLIKTFGGDAFEALKKGKMNDFIKKQKINDVNQAQGKNPYLQNLMEVAPTLTDTNAADFLAKYKDFRDRTFKLSRRWSDPRVEEVEKQKMGIALKEARSMQAKMKEVLDEGLGEYKPEFERANKLYSEQVYPLRANPIVEKAAEGKNSSNILHDLRTNEEGMPLVRELVKQDPELLRNAVGQRYFSKPEEINNPNETMREYLGEMPELKQLLKQKQNADTNFEQAKSNAELAKQHHSEISSRDVEAKKIQKKIDDFHSAIKENEKEISDMKSHIESLQKTAKSKNITLKEKMQTERELKDLLRQLKELSSNLDEKTTGLRKLYRIAKTAYRVGKKII